METKVNCPVCGKYVFAKENDFDICDVCGWENDGVQTTDLDYWGGANDLTANESKILYELSLCDTVADELASVTKAHKNKNAEIHRKYRNIDWRINGDKATREFRDEHDKFVKTLLALQKRIYI